MGCAFHENDKAWRLPICPSLISWGYGNKIFTVCVMKIVGWG